MQDEAPAPQDRSARAARSGPEMALLLVVVVGAAGGVGYVAWMERGPGLWLAVAGGLLVLLALLALRVGFLLRRNRRVVESFRASDDFKTQLLRFISHEIANPLSPLKLQTGILRQGAPDPARAWSIVDRSLGRLESLSRDVRLMALVETRRLVQSTEPADVVPRVAAAAQTYHGLAAQRKVQLLADLPGAPVVVPVDGERFDQVVDNLLSNAVKFTPAGGTVHLHLWKAPGGAAVLEVRDSGAGMTPEQQARLFSAFGRPQGSTTPGLGLGLYLCKAIVDGHGGRISATSEGADRGATFRIELPPARSAAKASAAPQAYAPAKHGGPEVPAGRPPDLPV